MVFGNPAERPSIPEPISRVVRKPERKDIEEKERQNRMKLGVLWHDRKITTEKLHERGIRLDPTDIERYSRQREGHRAMKGSEAAGLAEEVFLEGADTGGMTKERGEPHAWFGDAVVAYPAHPYDDVLRGADVVLMFIDPEDERKAHPVVVDLTTDRLGYDQKFAKNLKFLSERGLSNIYWVETAGGPGEYFDNPAEGRVEALNLSVYLPKEAVIAFTNEKASTEQADRVMRNLGPFVVRQMQSEMEALAMQSLHLNPREARNLSREALLSMLEAAEHVPERLRHLLVGTLPTIWESADRLGSVDPSRRELLPESILERPPLQRRKKSANAA